MAAATWYLAALSCFRNKVVVKHAGEQGLCQFESGGRGGVVASAHLSLRRRLEAHSTVIVVTILRSSNALKLWSSGSGYSRSVGAIVLKALVER